MPHFLVGCHRCHTLCHLTGSISMKLSCQKCACAFVYTLKVCMCICLHAQSVHVHWCPLPHCPRGNNLQLTRFWSDLVRFTPIYPDLPRFSSIFPIFPNLVRFGPIYPDLVRFGPIWANLSPAPILVEKKSHLPILPADDVMVGICQSYWIP